MKKKNWLEIGKEQRLELVIPLANKGLTARQISECFYNASRNAIIGFCHREKITFGMGAVLKENSPVRERRQVRRKIVKVSKPRPEKPAAAEKPVEIVKEVEPVVEITHEPVVEYNRHVSMMELNNSTCRWPISESFRGMSPPDMMFCGAHAPVDNSYCTKHDKIAHGYIDAD